MLSVVEVVVDVEEGVEEEELADGVGEVHELDGHVAGDEIVAVQLAADDAAHLGDEVLDADHAAGAVLALSKQVSIHLVDDVSDRLHTHTHGRARPNSPAKLTGPATQAPMSLGIF